MCPCLSAPYRAKGCSEEDASGGVNEMSCLTGRVNTALYLSLCSFKQTQTWDSNKEVCWDRQGAVTRGHVLLRSNRSSYSTSPHPPFPSTIISVQLLHGCLFILLLLFHNLSFAHLLRCTLPALQTTQKRKNGQHSFYWFGFFEYSGYFSPCGIHRQEKTNNSNWEHKNIAFW